MSKPIRPSTPALDAARADEAALQQHADSPLHPLLKPVRPATPALDAARAEEAALLAYEAEAQEFAFREQEVAASRARAARIAQLRASRAACAVAAKEAEQAVAALVAALDRFVAASELPAYQVNVRVTNFLARHVRKYGQIQPQSTGVADELMDDLHPEGV